MATNEKMGDQSIQNIEHQDVVDEHIDDVDVVKKVHIDGTVDLVDTKAIGGDLDEMPKGYFRSPQFIGTVIVRLSRSSSSAQR